MRRLSACRRQADRLRLFRPRGLNTPALLRYFARRLNTRSRRAVFALRCEHARALARLRRVRSTKLRDEIAFDASIYSSNIKRKK